MLPALALALAFGREVRAEDLQAVYHFIDERGVVHFSNVPADPRYRRLLEDLSVAPRFDERVPALAVVVSGPDTAAKGRALDLSVTIPGSPSVRGHIDLAFDPAALRFDESSADAEVVGPGRLRLEVDPGIAAAFAADVRFIVREDAPGQTVVHNEGIDLESEERLALRAIAASPVTIQLTPGRP
jgi:hypothetical protein